MFEETNHACLELKNIRDYNQKDVTRTFHSSTSSN